MPRLIRKPIIGQHHCLNGYADDCKRIVKDQGYFLYKDVDDLDDGECAILKAVVYKEGKHTHIVSELELREYEKGTDLFDILADNELLRLYHDGE